MRNNVSKAILIAKRDVNEKDVLLEFLSENLGYIIVRDYASQSNGSKSFMLYNTGDIYLYKSEVSDIYTLKDSKLQKARTNILRSDNMLRLSALAECIKYFSKFSSSGFFECVDGVFDILEGGGDFEKVFVNTVEIFLSSMRGDCYYEKCPICSREYNDDEVLGYSNEFYIPVCNDCADIKSVLLPGMRKYLNYTKPMTLSEKIAVDINNKALENVLKYEKFQLGCINPKGFRALGFV